MSDEIKAVIEHLKGRCQEWANGSTYIDGGDIEAIEDVLERLEASRSPPQEAGEPVAWRVKDFADGWFFYGKNQEAEATRAQVDGFLVQPLYRSPPTDPRTKALEEALRFYADQWIGEPYGDEEGGQAVGIEGRPTPKLLADEGRIARAALSPVQAAKGDDR